MKKSTFLTFSISFILSLVLSACNFGGVPTNNTQEQMAQTLAAIAFTQTAMAQEPEPVPTEATPEPPAEEESQPEPTEEAPVVTHQITPGEPGWVQTYFFDTDSSPNAALGYVTSGDDFVANLFERPFTETEMGYRPEVDINKAEISADNTFIYVTITLHAPHPEQGLPATYGVEIDADKDGRGDLLVLAEQPASPTWDIAGVSIYQDADGDVGGATILRPDANDPSNGYEEVVFSRDVLNDPDAAWVRIAEGTPPSVTIALKKSLIPGDGTFVWGVWAAQSVLDPAKLDLHDHYTQEQAGSPYQSHTNYPLAALNLVDNTCREVLGFEPTSPIPGLCAQPESEETPETPEETPGLTQETMEVEQTPEDPTPTPSPTVTPTEELLGVIAGSAFDDLNNDGDRDGGEPLTVYDVTITLRIGSCSGTILETTNQKAFTFSGLSAGTYCVQISGGATMNTPDHYVVTLDPGGYIYVEFGYYVVI